MRSLLFLSALIACFVSAAAGRASIRGESEVSAETMTAFVQKKNPDFDPAIAEAFIAIGRRYGIRGDIALCQAILETGWFRFSDGTAVTPDQHNYCGLGVTKRGLKGCSFETVEQGVTAMIQHLYAYCCQEPLPEGEALLDPRFRLVSRGIAPCWQDLSNRWAINPLYGDLILKLYSDMSGHAPVSAEPEPMPMPLPEVREAEDDIMLELSAPPVFF